MRSCQALPPVWKFVKRFSHPPHLTTKREWVHTMFWYIISNLTFYHSVPRNFWYSFYRPRKDERLSQPWNQQWFWTWDRWIENPSPKPLGYSSWFCIDWNWHLDTERWSFGVCFSTLHTKKNLHILHEVTYLCYHLCHYFIPANCLGQRIEFWADKVKKY